MWHFLLRDVIFFNNFFKKSTMDDHGDGPLGHDRVSHVKALIMQCFIFYAV